MQDFSNEIFTKIKDRVHEVHGSSVKVVGEYVDMPKTFPCVAIDEIYNVPAELDSGESQKGCDVTYRVQIFSNKKNGKRSEARAIFSTISDEMYSMNLIGKTYTTTPEVYNASIYQIRATFDCHIRADGTMFRR